MTVSRPLATNQSGTACAELAQAAQLILDAGNRLSHARCVFAYETGSPPPVAWATAIGLVDEVVVAFDRVLDAFTEASAASPAA